MTETDATERPLEMPQKFLPYLEKYRIYKLLKDMLQDLVLNLPKDHLKHMKVYLKRHLDSSKDVDRVILLVSPELKIDVKKLVHDMIKDFGFYVITRRCVMDRYEKHDSYDPNSISPAMLSEMTKLLTLIDPVPQTGWLLFDHPCTVREARCLQQDGVLPTVTLALSPPAPLAPPSPDPHTPHRSFYQQDFEGLKIAYKATLKEVYIEPNQPLEQTAAQCMRAVRAAAAGAQGSGQGFHATGAPGVYRVLLIGPSGCGRATQARATSRHFDLVHLNFRDLLNEARARADETAERLRKFGLSEQLKAEIVKRRIAEKDCIDQGWVLAGYPMTGADFEHLDRMPTPPNRIIFLNVPRAVCKSRVLSRGVDWCTGKDAPLGSGGRVLPRGPDAAQVDEELDNYFSENLAELRAAAGITAVEVDGTKPIDEVQVKVQAAIMASPSFNIECSSQLRNVEHADELMY
ncbi:adenylate kinase 8-like [Bicyclus anynana]|uniref:Adenylate kinase 8-like n=1 Tax=Bicyclus anynana TaxID=110368 RepID=A0ABM3M7J8_BICAN|nr:adenylate kinase 8-like [Bicyclus anynana]